MTVLVLVGGGTAWAFGRALLPGGDKQAAATSSPTPKPVPASVLDCKESVQAGDLAVAKAYQSYRDWYRHVKAQWDLDKGKITLDKAYEIWDETHARGSSDMNAFDAQRIVYERQEGACGKVPDSVPDKYDSAVGSCQKRAKAISTTMEAGIQVGNDWMKHVLAERNKDNIPSYDYHRMWVKAVKKAPKALGKFEGAHGKYKMAPECKLPKAE
ncbi:MAG: hypothetical protein GEV07_08590 [Streptosporangiales bacterium]|nr:hypothetical protein [Streptosporangiales bacterium]